MHIGILIPQFPGQTHIFFWREILALEDLGVTVTIFSTRRPPAGIVSHAWSDEAMARTVYLGDMSATDVLGGLPSLAWGELWRQVGKEGVAVLKDAAVSAPAARKLIREAKARGVDHLHAHSCGRSALIAALAHRAGGPGYGLTLHGFLQDYGPGQPLKWRNAAYATIITRSLMEETAEALGNDMPDRTVVQAMGVDTDAFDREAPYVPPEPSQPVRLFCCARLNRIKGHEELMQACRLLIDRGVDVRLDIAGEDDVGGTGYRTRLEAELARLNLSAHVRLLGAIDANAVRERLLDAHIFVLASFAEPLGVAYMEAMACGVPTIGTDAGGVPELIRDGVEGVLVPPQDPKALADAISRLASDPDTCRALSVAGRARIVEKFRATLGAETIRDLTAEALGTHA
ncbi:exopolysaccharide biosynthesis GT4 family glycosyltransferase EpsE [Pseudaestuariivita atlantica]|uniref:Glycosyl transferase family 1 n=1 Tax=Pseudaestuariivita atlantica TaxID=1317121 RepID=A0A0L1JP77_9RHOB|nr:exopolysaccharide biosynthesis GT4 family glycosyltransferase EpsE [Pseudaestuariivita atlantica]KNG93531.1 glycosyl transferase family 1 [Pseudaestuariivita atlantica]